jgi:NitT/TauT family transport system substrate-binding protein
MRSTHRVLTLLLSLMPAFGFAASPEPLRIGALAFGTLNWELATITHENLQKKNGITLKVETLAGPEAGKIAIQGNAVDVVVTDWIWVAQQRLQGQDLTFVPFSSIHGGLIVPKDSPIQSIKDLKGKRLGVAGGGQDKNWLLLKAAAQQSAGIDLDHGGPITFGAPPLLSEALKQGQLDAVLTYWNQAIRLESQGYRKLLDGNGILKLLGVEGNLPTLGFVFHEAWAKSHPHEIEGLLKAAAEAREKICGNDKIWSAIAESTQEPDDRVRSQLRSAYCEHPVPTVGPHEINDLARIFSWVTPEDTKPSPLPNGVFWNTTPSR